MKSITKLKDILFIQLAMLIVFSSFTFAQNPVSGTVRYKDNNEIVKEGNVKAFDMNGGLLAVTNIQQDGSYRFESLRPEQTDLIGFPNLVPEEDDFIPTYYPDAQTYNYAVTIYPYQALSGIDIYVERVIGGGFNAVHSIISGTITLNNKPISDAIIHAKSGNDIIGYGISAEDGTFNISVPSGDYILVIHRLGSPMVNFNINVSGVGINDFNVNLEKALPQLNNAVDFKLSQNYPNPFNPSTLISYTVKKQGNVNISVYNSAGQVVKELVNSNMNSGTYNVIFDGSNLSSGIYFYKMVSAGYTETKKMILVK